ncbi:hypothetical protein [Haloplanus salinarum]|uniref:hypothetical protein n=1 Tax=Haloplanus salinarum TaxID=1912324 RepID=UPI003B429DC2
MNIYQKQLVASAIPAAILSPLLLKPIPFYYHPGRALGGLFHTLGWIQFGWRSLLIQTPIETFSNPFHLHSLLAAPLVALGFSEGGRVISLLAAVAAAYTLGRIATSYLGPNAGYITIGVFWSRSSRNRTRQWGVRCRFSPGEWRTQKTNQNYK